MSNPIIEVWNSNQVVALKNSLIVRPYTLTGSWNTLRVGLVMGITTGSTANFASTPRLAIGICSGSTNVFGDAVCGHFVGIKTSTVTWTYSSQSANANKAYLITDAIYTRRSAGNPDYVTADISSNNMYFMTPDAGKGRMVYYLDMAKTGSGFNMTFYAPNSPFNSNFGKITDEIFLREMQSLTPTFAAAEQTNATTTAAVVPISEVLSGSFDAVNIAWDREAPNPDILVYAIAVGILN